MNEKVTIKMWVTRLGSHKRVKTFDMGVFLILIEELPLGRRYIVSIVVHMLKYARNYCEKLVVKENITI